MDGDLITKLGAGGLGVASLYVVYMVVKVFISYSGERQKAADTVAERTIDVLGKYAESSMQSAKATEAQAASNLRLAESNYALVAAIKLIADRGHS